MSRDCRLPSGDAPGARWREPLIQRAKPPLATGAATARGSCNIAVDWRDLDRFTMEKNGYSIAYRNYVGQGKNVSLLRTAVVALDATMALP